MHFTTNESPKNKQMVYFNEESDSMIKEARYSKEYADREFHSLSSERYVPSNMHDNNNYKSVPSSELPTRLQSLIDMKEKIMIRDQDNNNNTDDHTELKNEINRDIDAIQKRLLDSEIGQRDLKNRPDLEKRRLLKTGMGMKGIEFKDIINSGASIVMSKINKQQTGVEVADMMSPALPNNDYSRLVTNDYNDDS